MGETVDRDVSNLFSGCAAASQGYCEASLIGNGVCDMNCYNAACKWDGNDCGGPAINLAIGSANGERPNPATLVNPPTSPRAACMLTNADIASGNPPPAAGMPLPASNWKYNFWEECNGVGQCVSPGVGQAMRCSCPASCFNVNGPWYQGGNTITVANFDALNAERKCMYCAPPRPPCTVTGTCPVVSKEYLGIADRIEAWDGMLPDGSHVLSTDRKSGLNFTTPAATFDQVGGGLPGTTRPIIQHSCAGELGINLLSGNLQAGIHAPYLQDAVGFIAERVRAIEEARRATVSGTLTAAQFEIRFMFHHVAHWLYQFTWTGAQTLEDNPAFRFGSNLLSAATNTYFTDLLQMPWARREPVTNSQPSPSPIADWRRTADWARALRFDQFTSECSLVSATDGVDRAYPVPAYPTTQPAAQGARRCRMVWTGLRYLFAAADGVSPSDLAVYIDVNNDQCGGAATGAKNAPTLSQSTANYGLPAFSVHLDGAAGLMTQYPRVCTRDTDCPAYPGYQPTCVDIDARLLTLENVFKGKTTNPFAFFTSGGYNTGLECGTLDDLRMSLRQGVRDAAGFRRETVSAGQNLPPRFCMYNPQSLGSFNLNGPEANRFSWDTTGRCNGRNYSDPDRLCLKVDVPAQPAPWNFPVSGGPVRINNIGNGQAYAPPPAAAGVAPFQPNNRGAVAGWSRPQFTMSIPAITRAQFTNNWRERLRWALAQGLSIYGTPVPPEAVLILSVRDNADAFSPLPGGIRRGVTVQFAVECPTPDLAANVTSQLSGVVPGTLSTNAGPTLARLGLVPLMQQREIVFREATPVYPNTGPDGGTVFGIIVLLAIIGIGGSLALHKFYLKPKGIRVPLVPSPDKFAACFRACFGLITGKKGAPASAKPPTVAGGAGTGAGKDVESGSSDGPASPLVVKPNPLTSAATAKATTTTTAPAPAANPLASMASAPAPAPAPAPVAAPAAAEVPVTPAVTSAAAPVHVERDSFGPTSVSAVESPSAGGGNSDSSSSVSVSAGGEVVVANPLAAAPLSHSATNSSSGSSDAGLPPLAPPAPPSAPNLMSSLAAIQAASGGGGVAGSQSGSGGALRAAVEVASQSRAGSFDQQAAAATEQWGSHASTTGRHLHVVASRESSSTSLRSGLSMTNTQQQQQQ